MASRTSAGVYKRGRNVFGVKDCVQVEGLPVVCHVTGDGERFQVDKDPKALIEAAKNGNPVIAVRFGTVYYQESVGYDPSWERDQLTLIGIRGYSVNRITIADDGSVDFFAFGEIQGK